MARQYRIESRNVVTDPAERKRRLAEAFGFVDSYQVDKPPLDDRAQKLKTELADILVQYELGRASEEK